MCMYVHTYKFTHVCVYMRLWEWEYVCVCRCISETRWFWRPSTRVSLCTRATSRWVGVAWQHD